jgi:type I restriction enzyme S subunit
MNFTPQEQVTFSLQPGDVLVTEGSGSVETVGCSAVWEADAPDTVCFQNTLLRVRPRAGITDGRFLAWWVRHARLSGQIAAVSSGANIQHLGSDGLKRLQMDVPDLAEQRRIADFLDDGVARIDQIIAARKSQLGLSELHQAADLVAHVFSGSDVMIPCQAMAEVRLGRQRSPRHEAGEHMVPYLRSANVRDGEFDLDDVKAMNFNPSEQVIFQLRRGDVLVTEGSASPEAVGASAAWAEQLNGLICFQNTLIRLRGRSECDSEFLEVWARASHAAGAARTWSSGASILHLGSEGMSRMLMPRISLREQRSRANEAKATLEAHGRLRVELARSLNAITEYKQSLITAAVTGELDVTTAGSGISG